MIPGEIFAATGDIVLNKDRAAIIIKVANTGDRPIQVGSHYHFAETNAALAIRSESGAWVSLRHSGGNSRALRAGPVPRGFADPLRRARVWFMASTRRSWEPCRKSQRGNQECLTK